MSAYYTCRYPVSEEGRLCLAQTVDGKHCPAHVAAALNDAHQEALDIERRKRWPFWPTDADESRAAVAPVAGPAIGDAVPMEVVA